jgi:hypothetical protein
MRLQTISSRERKRMVAVTRGAPKRNGVSWGVLALILVVVSLTVALVAVSLELRQEKSTSGVSDQQIENYQDRKSAEKAACFASGGEWDPLMNPSGGYIADGGCRQ